MVLIGCGLMMDVLFFFVDELLFGLVLKIGKSVINVLMVVEFGNVVMIIVEQNVVLFEGWVDCVIGMYVGKFKGEVLVVFVLNVY